MQLRGRRSEHEVLGVLKYREIAMLMRPPCTSRQFFMVL